VFATNFEGTFLLSREAAKLMVRRKFGRIVNFATVAVPLKVEGESVYCASKAAIISFTEILARELAPFGITVNVVGPGPTDTDLIRGVPQAKIDALLGNQAIKRPGSLEDIAHVIDFYLDPLSHFITGQVIYLGGVR
jgi:3-oxoacyl-[acyl-carrier protein] reductase